MSLADDYALPSDFAIERANHGDTVEAADGTELCVLVSRRTGERELVHADVAKYDGGLEHPAAGGLIGFLGLLAVLVLPTAVGMLGGLVVGGSVALAGTGTFIGGVVGAIAANYCLHRTGLGDLLWRFLEWNDVKHLVERGDIA